MIMGDRGTGKSTTIRALADLLPEITVADDPSTAIPTIPIYERCCPPAARTTSRTSLPRKKVPMVDLPLSHRDRVCGTIDIEKPFLRVSKLLNRDCWLKQIAAFLRR